VTLIRGKLFIFDGGVTANTTNSQHPRNILALDNIKLSTDPSMPKEFKIHYGNAPGSRRNRVFCSAAAWYRPAQRPETLGDRGVAGQRAVPRAAGGSGTPWWPIGGGAFAYRPRAVPARLHVRARRGDAGEKGDNVVALHAESEAERTDWCNKILEAAAERQPPAHRKPCNAAQAYCNTAQACCSAAKRVATQPVASAAHRRSLYPPSTPRRS
jgi:hypothetical protein